MNTVDVCHKRIAGCLACEYCHTDGNGECIQKDDMSEIYSLLKDAEMLVIASPIYYHGITGQLALAVGIIRLSNELKNDISCFAFQP